MTSSSSIAASSWFPGPRGRRCDAHSGACSSRFRKCWALPLSAHHRDAQECAGARRTSAHQIFRLDPNRNTYLALMTDAEGIRNLVGTGLVQLVGGLVTAVMR